MHVDKYFAMDEAQREEIRLAAANFEYTKYTTTENSINHYHLDRYEIFTPSATAKLHRICAIVSAYNYDNSNSMVDYFDTNFYYDLAIVPMAEKAV